jgi:ribose-phosphate pyrophosphokinase
MLAKSVTVIAGSASYDLAKNIARRIEAKLIKTELKIFPDEETKITFKKIPKKGKIIIVQSTYPPVNSNLIELLSIITKAKEVSSNITVVMPYMGYARQDREFLPGEIVTMKVIAKLFKGVGVSKMIVADIHSLMGLKYFGIPTKNVTAVPELVKYFKKIKLKDPLIVSPDAGGIGRAKEFAKLFHGDFISLTKQRNRKTGKIRIITSNLDEVRGRDLILIDDIISTGGSIIKAAQFLKKQRCRRVFVACTHALLINDAEKKIKKAGVSQIISTNTIPGKTSMVDISGMIAKAIIK